MPQAIEAFGDVDVYTSAFRPMKNTISGAAGRTLMKLLVDPHTDRLLGCHMVGGRNFFGPGSALRRAPGLGARAPGLGSRPAGRLGRWAAGLLGSRELVSFCVVWGIAVCWLFKVVFVPDRAGHQTRRAVCVFPGGPWQRPRSAAVTESMRALCLPAALAPPLRRWAPTLPRSCRAWGWQ